MFFDFLCCSRDFAQTRFKLLKTLPQTELSLKFKKLSLAALDAVAHALSGDAAFRSDLRKRQFV